LNNGECTGFTQSCIWDSAKKEPPEAIVYQSIQVDHIIFQQFGTQVDTSTQRDLKLQKPNHPKQPLFLPFWISDSVLLLQKKHQG
jgi:hypothetical protein